MASYEFMALTGFIMDAESSYEEGEAGYNPTYFFNGACGGIALKFGCSGKKA